MTFSRWPTTSPPTVYNAGISVYATGEQQAYKDAEGAYAAMSQNVSPGPPPPRRAMARPFSIATTTW